jgi:hypothetical protein
MRNSQNYTARSIEWEEGIQESERFFYYDDESQDGESGVVQELREY